QQQEGGARHRQFGEPQGHTGGVQGGAGAEDAPAGGAEPHEDVGTRTARMTSSIKRSVVVLLKAACEERSKRWPSTAWASAFPSAAVAKRRPARVARARADRISDRLARGLAPSRTSGSWRVALVNATT